MHSMAGQKIAEGRNKKIVYRLWKFITFTIQLVNVFYFFIDFQQHMGSFNLLLNGILNQQ